MDQAKLN